MAQVDDDGSRLFVSLFEFDSLKIRIFITDWKNGDEIVVNLIIRFYYQWNRILGIVLFLFFEREK